MFRDREDAARQLAVQLSPLELRRPLVLAIPRGGVALGAVLARELGAELDVVLSRKLRAPMQQELAIGAVSESGAVHLNEYAKSCGADGRYVEQERRHQLDEISRRRELVRAVRPPAEIQNRSVILTDDGVATGSTMYAAVETTRSEHPHELIVAVPVAPANRIDEIRRRCDRVICLLEPDDFWAIGQFYEDFEQVDDSQIVELLREAGHSAALP